MIAFTYAELVGTAGFVLAVIGLLWQWYVRHTEPEQQLRIKRRIEESQAEIAIQPELRSQVLSVLHFIAEPEPTMSTATLMIKARTRLGHLHTFWEENQHLVGEGELRGRMREAGIADEIRWLDARSLNDTPDEVIHARFRELAERLDSVLELVGGRPRAS